MDCCNFTATFTQSSNLSASLGQVTEIISGDVFDGPYTVTPGEEPITLETYHKNMAQNVVIGAIPSNYGKITWNGLKLTVS